MPRNSDLAADTGLPATPAGQIPAVRRFAIEDCRDAATRLQALCQGAEILYEQNTETSPAAEALHVLLSVITRLADDLRGDLEAELMGRDKA